MISVQLPDGSKRSFERPVSVASVWKRSPMSSVGITYIATASEKTPDLFSKF